MLTLVNTGVTAPEAASTAIKIRDMRYLTFYFQGGSGGCNQCNTGYTSIYRKDVGTVKNYPAVVSKIDSTATDENTYIWSSTDLATNK